MPAANEGPVDHDLFLTCPDCGSLDTRRHSYEEDTAVCNECGAVFSALFGSGNHQYDNDFEEGDNDDEQTC